MNKKKTGITWSEIRRELRKKYNITAPKWLYVYLRDNNQLPVAQHTTGRGVSTLYDPQAIEVVRDYMISHGHVENPDELEVQHD
mgnify:CR=1 FL=1